MLSNYSKKTLDQNNKFNRVQYLSIDANYAGQRIDNFLFNNLKNIPKSRIYKMLRGGEVRVNKKRVSAFYKLKLDDSVRVPPYWSEGRVKIGKPSNSLIKLVDDSIIFEDEKIIVINKPSGIAVHSGSGIDFGIIEILRASRSDLKYLELAHRLDRETSGCLVLAKTRSALLEFHKMLFTGDISKKYILLVKGRWKGGEVVVDAPLKKNILQGGERMVVVDQDGKKSITIFKPLKVERDYSLIEAELKTGRTHQIRVHSAHIGYPIAGDAKYGNKEFNSKMKKLGLNRMFLHAMKIDFCWPGSESIAFQAKLDSDLSMVLDANF